IVDRGTAQSDVKYFAFAYDITGSQVWVDWTNPSTGQGWNILTDLPTGSGYRVRYLPVYDFMGAAGYFTLRLNGGKVYSRGDNGARQQLTEPFSQKVGLKIDTSTGAFGYEDRDLSVAANGPLPLVMTRYYSGHSDRFGSLGYRWTHSFDTRVVVEGNDAGVVFGSVRERVFLVGVRRRGRPPT